MTKAYFDILDSSLAQIIDEKQNQTGYEDEEVAQDFIDELEAIRGVIND